MGCLRIGVFFLGAVFALLAISALTVPYNARRQETETVNQVKAMLPQVREDFLLVQERFDVLMDGEFASQAASARNPMGHPPPNPRNPRDIYRWIITLRGDWHNAVRYEDWYTIDWISDEELEAIIFLASSREIEHNFTSISTSTWSGDEHRLRADIHLSDLRYPDLRYASLIIFYGSSNISPHFLFHHEHLGGSYFLYIYYGTPGVSLVPLFTFFGVAFSIAAVLKFVFSLFFPFLENRLSRRKHEIV